MTLCGYYVARETSYDSTQRWTVGWTIAVQVALALVAGCIQLNHWATADRTEEVLVCGTHKTGGEWIIQTSAGTRNLEAGFYNGTYYPTGSDAAPKSLVGNWVRITEHGYSSGTTEAGPWITRAQTLRAGSCG